MGDISRNGTEMVKRLRKLEFERKALEEEVQKLRKENQRWTGLVGTDSLTGLPNKLLFMQALVPQLIQTAQKNRQSIGFILLATDNLINLNEDYGWEGGDQIIQGLGNLLQSILGDEGKLGHIDGPSFAIVLCPSDLDLVRTRANMLRARIRSHTFPCSETTAKITVSLGIGTLEPTVPYSRGIIERTFRALNRALYIAKQAGGNRVEIIPSS